MFRTITVLFFLVFHYLKSFSQDYPFQAYSTDDGMPDMNVGSLFKDSRNYLWIGTGYGFSKFDGQKFTNFHLPPKIAGDNTLQIIEAKNGNLFLASSRNLYQFDGKTVWPLKAKEAYYNEIAFDNKSIFYASSHGKVYYCKSFSDSLKLLDWPILQNKIVRNFTYLPEVGKYYAQMAGIGIVQIMPNKYEVLVPSKTEMGQINYLYGPSNQRIVYTFSEKNATYFLLKNDGKLQNIVNIENNVVSIINSAPFDFYFANNGIGYILKANSKIIEQLKTEGQSPESDNFIYSGTNIYTSSNHGLLKIINNGFRHFTTDQVPACWSVNEDKKKQIWFWNTDFPTQIFNGKSIRTITGDFETVSRTIKSTFPNEIYKSYQHGWYGGVLTDKYGAIWKAHSFGVLRTQKEKFQFFALPDENHIYASFAVLEDTANNRILKGGVKSLHFIDNKAPFRIKTISKTNGLNIETSVYSLALENPGLYWIGSTDKLIHYDSNKNIFKEYSNANKKFLANDILDLTFDDKRTLWLATASKGLQYFDHKLDKVVAVEALELQEPVLFIGQVNSQYLLIGSYTQLYLFDVAAWHKSKKILFKAYNSNNGYRGNQPNQEGYLKASDGKIWVTSGLLTTIDTNKLNLKNDSLSTYFTKFNSEQLPFDYKRLLLKTNGTFRAEFEAVGENRAQDTQYSYFLTDISKDWSSWQTEPVVTINSLASGNYTLKVRSRTGNGDLSFSKPATLHFKVSIMPWQSPNFPFYVLFSLFGLVSAFYLYRLKQKKVENLAKRELAKQEQLILLKDLEAREQSLKVQALQVQTAQAQMNPHFTFNTINAIQNLIFSNADAANESLSKLSKIMRIYLNASVNAKIDPQNKDFGMIRLKDEIDLVQLYCELEKLQHQTAFNFTITVDPTIAQDYYKIPPLIIQPFVENAILHGVLPNHSKVGMVQIIFSIDADETLTCQIIDDGIGREVAAKLKIQQAVTHESHGTNLVNSRVAILNKIGANISIEYSENVPSGTIVTIKHYI